MTRRVALLLVFVLAGCGTHARPIVRAPAPKLPRTLARGLAQDSDEIARHLDRGDTCGAHGTATDLQHRTIEAINAGKVPASFQEPLLAAVNRLAATIRCVPPAPEKRGKHEGEGKHRGKKKHQGKDE
jgi:hypothetical protein